MVGNNFALQMATDQRLKKLFAAFLKDHALVPFSSSYTLTILKVTWEFSKANMYADCTYTAIVSNDITELISMTKKELLNISDWMRVKKLNANSKNRIYGYWSRKSNP